MLVLRRRVNESILIGSGIKVTILAVESNRLVKIGIDAPYDVTIVREELLEEDIHEKDIVTYDR